MKPKKKKNRLTDSPFFSYRYVRPDNVTDVLAIAKEVRAQRLVDHCQAFIANNLSFVEAFENGED